MQGNVGEFHLSESDSDIGIVSSLYLALTCTFSKAKQIHLTHFKVTSKSIEYIG